MLLKYIVIIINYNVNTLKTFSKMFHMCKTKCGDSNKIVNETFA